MCCLNMGINLKILKMSPQVFCMTLYTESLTDQNDHFADAFVRKSVADGYDVRKFTAEAILFREVQHKKRDMLYVLAAFSV